MCDDPAARERETTMVTPWLTRRDMLKSATCGFGYLAFSALASEASAADARDPLAPRPPHFPPRARRVIFLAMRGAPSQMDLFDYKPQLQTVADQPSQVRGRRYVGSPWRFRQHGQGGIWISELLPRLTAHADDLCVIKSMRTDDQTHTAGFVQLHTGSARFVRPSIGAWVLYGLGADNANLPGFITIGPSLQFGGAQNYGSAFLPALYQGTPIRDASRPNGGLENIVNRGLAPAVQRRQLDLVQALNRGVAERNPENSQLESVIQSYELAFRMQRELPRVLDLSGEARATQQMYGIDAPATDRFGRQCLLARRLIEEGVRFVELMDEDWDQHLNLRENLTRRCQAVDQPIAALLTDLKRRGLLQDTLVVWGGEFGRTPDNDRPDGRNHNNTGFTIWLAGGGVRPGIEYGQTDEFGYRAVENEVHLHDLHATILHLLGLDHTRLTYRHAGRDFRLTDVYGRVVREIVA
jgi:hypothetical protein